MARIPDKIIDADREADFLLLAQPQSRSEKFNRFSVSDRNVAFFIREDKMPIGIYKRTKKHNKNLSKSHKGKSPWNKGKKFPQFTGKNASNWKGGKRKHKEGYILLYKPKYPSAMKDGYILEHRFLIEKKIKRRLKPFEQIHHLNGIKDDNRLENLQLFNNRTGHTTLHNKKRNQAICPKCGFEFLIK